MRRNPRFLTRKPVHAGRVERLRPVLIAAAVVAWGTGLVGTIPVASANGGSVVANGAPVTATISSPLSSAKFTFTATSNEVVTATATGGTFPGSCDVVLQIVDSFGDVLGGSPCSGSSSFVGETTLPGAGTYTLQLVSQDSNPGSVSLSLSANPGNGSIGVNGSLVTFTSSHSGQGRDLVFNATANSVVTVTSNAGTFAGNCDLTMQILDPEGGVVAGPTCGAIGSFLKETTLPVAGAYILDVAPTDGNTGHVSLSLSANPSAGTIAANGAPVTFTSTHSGQGQDFTFTAPAGEVVTATSSGGTFAANCDLSMQVLDPQGDVVMGPTCGAQGGFLGEATLANAGTYILDVIPSDGNTGHVSLSLSSNPAPATIVANGPPVTFTSTHSGQGQDFTFTATAGEVVTLTSSGGTFSSNCDLVLMILKPNGVQVGGSLCGAQASILGETTLVTAGVYTIDVVPQDGSIGQVSLSLSANPAAGTIVANGAPVTFTSTHSGQGQDFTFTGTAGEVVTATSSGGTFATNCDLVMTIIQPNGVQFGGAVCSAQGSFLTETTLLTSGTYTLDLYPQDGNMGSVNLSLSANPAAGAVVVGGAPATFNSTHPGQGQDFTFSVPGSESVTIMSSGGTFANNCDLIVKILNPNGFQVGAALCAAQAATLGPTALPAAGLYTMDVVPQDGSTGSVGLTATSP